MHVAAAMVGGWVGCMQAMEQLWRVVAAPDPKATVKRFLPQVLHELAGASLGSRKWRERQAAASALAEV